MIGAPQKVREISDVAPERLPLEELMEADAPVVFKGMASGWPLSKAAAASADAAAAYLLRFYNGKPVVAYRGAPEIGGRFFYDAAVSGLNFESGRVPLGEVLQFLLAQGQGPDVPAAYVGSTDLDLYLPGLRAENDLPQSLAMFAAHPPTVSIWIGNRTIAAAHYDMSNNLACCVAGRRRFTLFPPDQVGNLYPGPLEPTPGGQVVSMVDLRAPDLDRYPRAAEAIAAAQVAELEPGDVLFYPALWWHQVEALEPFNILINYWWNQSPAFVDTPMTTLLHGLLSLRDRPEPEKRAWRALMDYYVFGPADRAAAHLPDHAVGALGRMDETRARKLRAQLINRLNR